MSRIENRAWFFDRPHNYPVRVYVMFDRKDSRIQDEHLWSGKKIEIQSNDVLKFYVEKTKKATLDFLLSWDFLPNSADVMLVNEKAKKVVLDVAGNDCQIIPALITMYDGTVIDNYSVVNITTRKQLLNKEKSILYPEEERESWRKYQTLYYNKNCLGDSNFARSEDNVIFLCSEKFRQAVLSADLKGLSFNESRGPNYFLDE